MLDDFVLETRSLVKEFKGFVAVNGVSLNVRRGHIHALIGPNGAGKTTVFNLLTKFLAPTRGSIFFNGTDITAQRPAQVARRGIVRSFQMSAVFPHLSVLENVRLALQRKLGTSFHFWRSVRTLAGLHARARELLAEVNLDPQADRIAVELPYGSKRALEIATTLALEPELLLLDEPFSALDALTRERFDLALMAEWRRPGMTVIVVSHSIPEAILIADRIVVLCGTPGTVVGEIAVELPRPRSLEALESPEAVTVTATIRALLAQGDGPTEEGPRP